MIETLGWTLVHFLWQGALIAVLLALAPGRKPETRYATACTALLLMIAAPLATFWRLGSAVAATVVPGAGRAVVLSLVPAAAPPASETALAWVVRIWLCGVLACSLRWLAGWWMVQRYERATIEPAWQQALARLCRQLAVSRPVRLYRSADIAVPVVIGWLRPLILMPAGALAGLSCEQLEAILARGPGELALLEPGRPGERDPGVSRRQAAEVSLRWLACHRATHASLRLPSVIHRCSLPVQIRHGVCFSQGSSNAPHRQRFRIASRCPGRLANTRPNGLH